MDSFLNRLTFFYQQNFKRGLLSFLFKGLLFRKIFFYCSFCLIVIGATFSCSSDKKYDKSKAITIIEVNQDLKIDESLNNIKITIPNQRNNEVWLGSPSLVNQTNQNISKNFSYIGKGWFKKYSQINLKKSWYKNIFYMGDFAKSFVYSPIIINDKIFNIDSSGDVTAFALNNKKILWHKRIFEKLWLKNYKVAHIGACGDKLFAVAGVNQIKAINQNNGEIIWEKESSAVFSSTPICDKNFVYLISNENKTFALNQASGEIHWVHFGISKSLAILGNPNPALVDDIIIAPYSSGEVYAIDKKTGKTLWVSDLNSYRSFNSNSFLSDVDATPLIKDGVVYAIGNGGLMKAIKLKNGEDLWKKPLSSVVDFWLAGDFLYVINNDSQLMAIYKKTGTIKWYTQLPKYKNPKKITSKYNYIGVIMAGDRLLIDREDGEIFIISPFDGKIEKTYSLKKRVLHSPIIVNDKIYFYGMSRFKTKLIELE